MSIRFAAPPQAMWHRLRGAAARAAVSRPANAEAAWFADERDAYRWWLGICRTLDRRMARELAAQVKDAS